MKKFFTTISIVCIVLVVSMFFNAPRTFVLSLMDNSSPIDTTAIVDTIPEPQQPICSTVVNNIVTDTIPFFVNTSDGASVYYVNIQVNSVPMMALFDTGCSTFSMSTIEYQFLKKHGYIKTENIISTNKAVIANGDTVNVYNIVMDEVVVGIDTIKNVETSVFDNPNAPLLIGQGVLSKLGDLTISYKNGCLVIHK